MALAGIFFSVFYIVFTPLTIYPVYWLLSIFYPVTLSGAVLAIQGKEIEIISACVAGAAYFFLFALNLSTGNIRLKPRISVLLIDFSVFLVLNILRIFFLSVMLIKETVFFETVHLLLWYVFSILLVFLIWIVTVKSFRIKNIPFYSDIAYLKKLSCKERK